MAGQTNRIWRFLRTRKLDVPFEHVAVYGLDADALKRVGLDLCVFLFRR